MSDCNENLWAPWRMDYIRSLDDEAAAVGGVDGGCFICGYLEDPQRDVEHHVLWRSDHAVVLMNRFPYTNGHLMVAPLRHVGDPADLTEVELVDLTRATYQCVAVMKRVLHAQGFNVGSNIGRCAGAGLPDHLHNHVVARWEGDTNYMAVLGGVRVIPDALDATYRDLVAAAVDLGFCSA